MEGYVRHHLGVVVLFTVSICLTALMYNALFMHRILNTDSVVKPYVPIRDLLSQGNVRNRWKHAAEEAEKVELLNDSTTLQGSHAESEVINVAVVAKFAYKRMKILRNIVRCVGSILKRTNSTLHLHVLLDNPSKMRVSRTLQKVSLESKKKIQTSFHDVIVLSKKFHPTIAIMRKYFFTKDVGRYNDDIFFISEVFHRIFSTDKIIMLDLDIKFLTDITQLYRKFDQFDDNQLIGIANDQQPQYRHDFAGYRNLHPGTDVGSARPGKQGFNTGVVLFHLDRMRKSRIYNTLLLENSLSELCNKYGFKGYLGHQDFFTLAGMEYPDIFHVLDCSWNRQLDTGWKKTTGAEIFNIYHSCNGTVKVYHGNGEAFIPDK